MERPDQKKFAMFITPLVKLDAVWHIYAQRYGYTLELNPYRKPGRTLRHCITSLGCNVIYTVELYMEPFWYNIEYSDKLPYSFVVCAFCDKVEEQEGVRWKLAKTLAENIELDKVEARLPDYLNQAFKFIEQWTPDYVFKYGKPIKYK